MTDARSIDEWAAIRTKEVAVMRLKRVISATTAALLALLGTVAVAAPAATVELDRVAPQKAVLNQVVDPETHHEYPGTDEAETYFATTGHAGRVWTDKTVFTDAIRDTTEGGADTLLADDEFGIALSALGSTRHIDTRVPVPIDVVLVLDVSGSMAYCTDQSWSTGNTTSCTSDDASANNYYQNSRAYSMVTAVNTALGIIQKDNPNNRVALSYFSNTVDTMQSLGAPKMVDSSQYVSLRRASGGNLYLNYRNDNNQVVERQITGGTNTQLGMAQGMNLLANQTKSTVTGANQHLPNVVLLTDGVPTYSSSSESWWAPADNSGNGNGSTAYYGNGFKAAMTASYLKNKIATVYHDDSNPVEFDPKVYTVGLGVDQMAQDDGNLSKITLDPATYYGRTDNTFFSSFKTAFENYVSRGTTSVTVNGSGNSINYTVDRPATEADRAFDVDDIRYNDAFYAPATEEDMIKVFTDIAKQITDRLENPPVQTDPGSESASGYVTFTDTLGQFMEVAAMDRVTFCSLDAGQSDPEKCVARAFTDPVKTTSEDGMTDTYTFRGTYAANDIYGAADVSSLEIKVTRNANPVIGDVVEVKIPSTLLPLRDSYITVDEEGTPERMSVEVSHPVHVYYVVSPKEVTPRTVDAAKTTVVDYLADPALLNATKPGWGTALNQYVRDNVDDDGQVRFYANAFDRNPETGAVKALANATFLPANGNLFYRFGEDTTLYHDADAMQPISVSDWESVADPIHYVYESYRQQPNDTERPVVLERVVLSTTKELLEKPKLNDGAELTVKDGVMTAPAGMRNYARAANIDHVKCLDVTWNDNGVPTCEDAAGAAGAANLTGTDPMVRETTYADQIVVVSLGNNGFLEAPASGMIDVTKTAENGNGELIAPETPFTFQLDVTVTGGNAPGQFPVEVLEHAGQNRVDGFDVENGGTFTLKANQMARVYGLPHGATYTVTEVEIPGGYTPSVPQVSGQVDVGVDVPEIAFTNTYVPAPAVVDGPSVTKVMDTWPAGVTFEALLWSAESATPVDRVQLTASGRQGTFDAIEFSKVGTYTYTITEHNALLDHPGVTFSAASYLWVVEVSDDGTGQLTAETTLTQLSDDAGSEVADDGAPDGATFTNSLDPNAVSLSLPAQKWVQDATLADEGLRAPELSHDFRFWYAGMDLQDGEGASAEDVPESLFPQGDDKVDEAFVKNAPKSADVASPRLTFNAEQNGHVYYYGVEEISQDLPFVDYDESVHFYRVAVGAGDAGVQLGITYCTTTQAAVTDGSPLGTCTPESFRAGTAEDGRVPAAFINLYQAQPAELPLSVTKILEGRPWNDADAFEFVLEPSGEITEAAVANQAIKLPGVATATRGNDGNVQFDAITFRQQGTYQFTVREVIPDGAPTGGTLNGITYDRDVAVYNVVVTNPGVTGGESDQLSAELVAPVPGVDNDQSTFTNTYAATAVSVEPQFVKTLNGRDWLPTDRFTFTLAPETDGAPMPGSTSASVTTKDEGFTFGSIRFATPGTYRYSVVEQGGDIPGIRYDANPVTFAIEVVDNGLGRLTATVVFDDGDREFVNEYVPTTWTLSKSSNQDAEVLPGAEITYTITAANTSGADAAPVTDVVITDDLSDVLGTDDARKAEWVGFVGEPAGAEFDGTTLTWTLDELSGEQTLSYTVKVADDAHGVTLRNVVMGMGNVGEDGQGGTPPETCVAGTDAANEPGCFTVHTTDPKWTLAKSSTTPDQVMPGDTIDYRVDVTLLGAADTKVPGVVVVDDLTDVLANAEFNEGSIVVSAGSAELAEDGTLVWTIGDLTADATLTYSVTVNADAYGVDLVNVVTGSGGDDMDEDGEGDTPPLACVVDADPECTTVHTTDPAWTIEKSSPTAAKVAPGETVEYQVDVTFLGDEGTNIPGVVVVDDLADVLANAEFNEGSIVVSAGSAELAEDGTLVWTIGDLTADATLTYSVTVNADAFGVDLVNVVTGSGGEDTDDDGTGDDTPPLACVDGEEEQCSTTHSTDPTWTLTKSSDDPDGTVVPGQLITYTLTATVIGEVHGTVPNVVITDDLSGVLGHATLVEGSLDASQGVLAEGDESTLVWTIDPLEEVATATYTVKVAADAYGVDLVNVVTGSGGPDDDGNGDGDNPPTTCAADAEDVDDQCTTTHTVDPTWTLAKTSDDPDGEAEPGQVITYTLTATPLGESVDALTGLVITDDLSDVVADGKATFEAILGDGANAVLNEEGTALVWTLDGLTEAATLQYTVRVADDAYGVTLRNVVTGTSVDGSLPPATCAAPELMDPATLDVTPMALGIQALEFIDEECSTVHVTDPADPEPSGPTGPAGPEGPAGPAGPEGPAADPVTPTEPVTPAEPATKPTTTAKVSTGGMIAGASTGLLWAAGALLVGGLVALVPVLRRRRNGGTH